MNARGAASALRIARERVRQAVGSVYLRSALYHRGRRVIEPTADVLNELAACGWTTVTLADER